MDEQICRKCGVSKPLDHFGWTVNRQKTKSYRLKTCTQCKYSYQNLSQAQKERRSQAQKEHRMKDPVWSIWIDARSSDRKAVLENDLTKEFIAEELAKGCIYCGESEVRMTLDRIDNNLGHLMSNVVPACIRCNYTRKDMPYKAWLVVAKGMREARVSGLFGGWTGRAK